MEITKINKLIDSYSQVKLFYFDEEIYCQILKESKNLILVRDIKDWHYDAYMIFPKKYIKKIKYGKIEKCKEKILLPLKKQQFAKEINNIDLFSIKNTLQSLSKRNQGLCIENANDNNYIFALGVIKELKDNNILLREINLCGKYKKKSKKINYEDITCVFYKDEYSTKLIDYAIGSNDIKHAIED